MKTLEQQTLLYDQDCPLCKTYTEGFIKTKMLDRNGRIAYGDIVKNEYEFINFKRAVNEIALIDTKNKTAIYGIDSLLTILSHSIPLIKLIGNIKPVKFILRKFYSFISYNRKVILPSKKNGSKALQCVPDFNYNYRYLYLLFTSIITSIILFNFCKTLSLITATNILWEFLIVVGQLIFQGLFIQNLSSEKRLNYYGNLMTVSLMGSLILIPAIVLNLIIRVPYVILNLWFGLTVFTMLYEHMRRVNLLALPKYLTLTWVIYCLILLIFILII